MAYYRQARHARQYHAALPSVARPGAQPGRERLAVSSSELDLKHRLRKLRRHRRRRMRRLAKADRRSRENHIHRNARMGSRRSVTMTFGIIDKNWEQHEYEAQQYRAALRARKRERVEAMLA